MKKNAIETLPEFFWADRLTLVNFYGYTSSPNNRIFEMSVYSDYDKVDKAEEMGRFYDLKRKCIATEVDMRGPKDNGPVWTRDVWDDKITIECLTEDGKTIYVGYWGNTFSIGTTISARNREPRPYREGH